MQPWFRIIELLLLPPREVYWCTFTGIYVHVRVHACRVASSDLFRRKGPFYKW